MPAAVRLMAIELAALSPPTNSVPGLGMEAMIAGAMRSSSGTQWGTMRKRRPLRAPRFRLGPFVIERSQDRIMSRLRKRVSGKGGAPVPTILDSNLPDGRKKRMGESTTRRFCRVSPSPQGGVTSSLAAARSTVYKSTRRLVSRYNAAPDLRTPTPSANAARRDAAVPDGSDNHHGRQPDVQSPGSRGDGVGPSVARTTVYRKHPLS